MPITERNAEQLNQDDHTAAALAMFDAILAQSPNDARALAHRAELYTEIGRFNLAKSDIDRAMRNGSHDAFVFSIRALAEQNEDKQTALMDATRAIDLAQHSDTPKSGGNPDFILLDQRDMFFAMESAYTLRAEIRKERREFTAALADVDAIVDLDPNHASARIVRASIERALGDFAAALNDDLAALAAHENSAPAIIYLCDDYASAGRFDEARRRCDEAIVLFPRVNSGYLGRGGLYLKMGQWSLAQADFESALALVPPGQTSPLALYGRGLARLGAGDPGGKENLSAAIAGDAHVMDWFRSRGLGIAKRSK